MTFEFSKIDIKDLACFIHDALSKQGISAVLVGGACVSIYSHNRYQSYDLDFVVYEELKEIEKVLTKYGFRRLGRCFSHDDCPFLIDFVNPPVAIGNASVREFATLNTPMGSLQLLKPTDCVKDRLASFIHWNDLQALEQALLVAKEHKIDLKEIVNWANEEGNHKKKIDTFLERLKLENDTTPGAL